jgi:tripartite ATP-independent transporter DctM subunit
MIAVLFLLLFALMAIGTPVYIAMAGSGLAYLLLTDLGSATRLPTAMVDGVSGFELLAVPFFILTGDLMNRSGMTQRIIDLILFFIGMVRGALAYVSITVSLFASGISGSAPADASAVSAVLMPAMRRAGYRPTFAASVNAASAIIGPIMPPSIPMIFVALVTGLSVGQLFLGGVGPALLLTMILLAVLWLRGRRTELPKEDAAERSLGSLWRLFGEASMALLAPVIIVGGIRGGVFTATEAGAIAVIYVLAISTLVYRGVPLRALGGALVRAAHGTGTVLVILGASSIFAWIVADQGISRQFAELVMGLGLPPWAVLLLLNLMFFAVGMFLDPLAALIILVPIFQPLAEGLGMHVIQFGVMIVLNLMIGLCTPPVGYLIYMTAAMAEVGPGTVIRQSLPFVAVLVAVLMLVTYVPAVTLWLPAVIAGR